MSSRSLLIVDVQDEFSTSKNVIGETVRQIHLAKKRKAPIILVEFNGFGKSNAKVLNAIGEYKDCVKVHKNFNGGGGAVLTECTKNGIEVSKLRVVGVNRSYCVQETLKQIINKSKSNVDIEVSEIGTWCMSPASGLQSLHRLGCRII